MKLNEETKEKIEKIKRYFLVTQNKKYSDQEIIDMALDAFILNLQFERLIEKFIDYYIKRQRI